MTFAIEEVPFSACGSWLSLARLAPGRAPDNADGLYLRSHHGGRDQALIRLELDSPTWDRGRGLRANPTLLTFEDGAGAVVEACFDGSDSVRLRGRGAALRLEAATVCVLHGEADERVTINFRWAYLRVMLDCLRGRLVMPADWRAKGVVNGRMPISIEPDERGEWEIAFDEYASTWLSPRRGPFAACLAASDQAFEAWRRDMPVAAPEYAEAAHLAAYVNWSCIVSPRGQLRRPAMFMSKNWMCNVWSWDHCFNALPLAEGRPDLAWDQLLLAADHQDEHGAIADTINDLSKHYNYCKPPVHGWAAQELIRLNPAAAVRERLEAAYEFISRAVRWWLTHRRLDGQALPYYLHGNDSGWDNSTVFDRGVPLCSPDLAAFLIVAMDCLADLARRLELAEPAEAWERDAGGLLDSLLAGLWREDRFVAKLAIDGVVVEPPSLILCMPVVLGARLPEAVRTPLVARLHDHLTEHGLATERPDSPEYRPDGYWRGPIWAPTTCLAVSGLERCGRGDLALEIARRYCNLGATHGFPENYDALTGEPRKDRAYTWTASVFSLMAAKLVEAGEDTA